MAKIDVRYRNCNSIKTVKSGKNQLKSSPNGTQRYPCQGCRKYFQLEYKALGRLPKIKEKIIDMCSNGSGIRDIARVLKASTKTVINTIKKAFRLLKCNRSFIPGEYHDIGKRNTQKIERKFLTFRTRIKQFARKSICFSKSELMHDTVIGLYINRIEWGRNI
ncbi:IS1 family transposase [Fastidiosibacter lacustris]|uniref:IS1 family transposase n=1 Tax=Fastidiosibacter lacustris TaxID=2056695 RepID=UPI000E3426B3|nr:IS1 family transposase [Fastidiosibacter lacustris]